MLCLLVSCCGFIVVFDGFGVVVRLLAGCLYVNSVVDTFSFLFVGNVYCGCFDAIAGVFVCLVVVCGVC